MTVPQGGRVIATGGGNLTCTSPGAYRRMRGEHADARPLLPVPQPVAPSLVLRTEPRHVLLAPTVDPRCWSLCPHTTDKTLFAHENDHVPSPTPLALLPSAAPWYRAHLARA